MNRRRFLAQTTASLGFPYVIRSSALGLGGSVAPSNRITLGVIGVGSQGTVDLRAFLNHDDVQVVALSDVNQRHIESAKGYIQKRYGKADVQVFHDFRELNRRKDIDAVLMALPVHWHSLPAADAVLNGKHIYHEKPMGMSVEEAQVVRAAVKKSGVVFQFGTQQRSDLKFRWACELALNGRLGKLKDIQVAVPGGKRLPDLPEQPVPNDLDWDRWVGPAKATPFHPLRLMRDNHENMSQFSLGMIACWGIHHLDIAQWGNGTDASDPVSVEGIAEYPESGACDNMLGWKLRFEYATGAPITFANENRDGLKMGVRFIGENGWVHVTRGNIYAGDANLLRDPASKVDQMPVKLPISIDHTRNFVDAVKSGARAICDIDTAVHSDALCQMAALALATKRKLSWDPVKGTIVGDDAAQQKQAHRPFRGEWEAEFAKIKASV